MTAEQLRYVVELAHYQTMQKAAGALHITKSGLSRAIAQVEAELGVQLFDRTTSGTFLTPAGRQMLPLMEASLSNELKIQQRARRLRQVAGRQLVRIGYVNSLQRPISKEFFNFRRDNPQAGFVSISQYPAPELPRLVDQGELDLAFVSVDERLRRELGTLDFHPLYQWWPTLYLPSDHPLAAVERLTPAQLRELSFVTLTDPLSRRNFDRLQSLCGPLDELLRIDNYQLGYEAVVELRAAFLSCNMLSVTDPDLTQWPLTAQSVGHLVPERFSFGWLSNPRRPLDKATLAFVDRVCQRVLAATKAPLVGGN